MKNELLLGPNQKRSRWMVVDDDASVLEFITSVLMGMTDAEICCFRSAAAALNAFAATPESFGFVLTDLEMPGMSGIELCRRLQALSPGLKILLASGAGLVTSEEARQFGFCSLLNKPFPISSLRGALAAAGLLATRQENLETPPALCVAA